MIQVSFIVRCSLAPAEMKTGLSLCNTERRAKGERNPENKTMVNPVNELDLLTKDQGKMSNLLVVLKPVAAIGVERWGHKQPSGNKVPPQFEPAVCRPKQHRLGERYL